MLVVLTRQNVLPYKVLHKGVRRRGLILPAHNGLLSWCQQQDFGFHDSGTLSEDQQLLRRIGIHLTGQRYLCQRESWASKKGFK